MKNGIKFFGSETAGNVPASIDIDERGLAINLADGKMFSRDSAGSIVQLGSNEEIGGIPYSDKTLYGVGDIVSQGGSVYLCTTAISVAEVFDVVKWKLVGGPGVEHGGEPWDIAYKYKKGEIVSYNDAGYIARSSTRGDQPDTSNKKWEPVSVISIPERGGLAFKVGTSYLVGDVVSESSKLYINIVPVSVGPFKTSDWLEVGAVPEHGGEEWDATVQYKKGEIVSFNGVGYIAKTPSTNKQPDTSSAQWTPLAPSITQDGSNILLPGYVIAINGTAVAPTDTVNVALGKLEKSLQNATAGGGDVNVQSDWSETDSTQDTFIVGKPTIPVATTVVDDLTTGGTITALSAEQGKTLKGLVDINTAKTGITTTQAAEITVNTAKASNIQPKWNAVTVASGQIIDQPTGVIVEADRNVASGFAGLDATSKVLFSVLPALPTGDVHAAVDDAAMFALTGVSPGDIIIVEDTGELYFAKPGISSTGGHTLADFTKMLHPGAGVVSLNGDVGIVTADGSTLDATGYIMATVDADIDPTDKLNEALGKLELRVKSQYYHDLKDQQAANFNIMYAGIDTKKNGYIVNSTDPTNTGVFVGSYIADQDIGGPAEAKILLGTVYLDNLSQKQGLIYVWKNGSTTFVDSATKEIGGIIWKTTTDYVVGDIVSYGGKAFACIADHTSSTWVADHSNWSEDIIADPGWI